MTPTLGTLFPQNRRSGFCERHIAVGAVFRLYVPETIPPKIKRIVIIGINEELDCLGILFINSDISTYISMRPPLRKLQLSLDADNTRNYLDYDSYLDCSYLYERPKRVLKEKCISDTGIYLGQLSDTDVDKAKQLISSAESIVQKLKTRYTL